MTRQKRNAPAPRTGMPLPPVSTVDTVVAAWTDDAGQPAWHELAKADVRESMPALANALDRLATERGRV